MPQHLPAVRHFQLHHHVQRLVVQLRKWVGRIDHQRRQHRTHLSEVIVLDPVPVPGIDLVKAQKSEAVLRQRREQVIAPTGILLINHLSDPASDRVERFTRRPAIETALDHVALHLLFEPGDADLEELVEIGGCDGKEFDPFQQRRCEVSRLVEHALVEFQPAQLAVEEMHREGHVRRHRHNREGDSNVTARQKASYNLVTNHFSLWKALAQCISGTGAHAITTPRRHRCRHQLRQTSGRPGVGS